MPSSGDRAITKLFSGKKKKQKAPRQPAEGIPPPRSWYNAEEQARYRAASPQRRQACRDDVNRRFFSKDFGSIGFSALYQQANKRFHTQLKWDRAVATHVARVIEKGQRKGTTEQLTEACGTFRKYNRAIKQRAALLTRDPCWRAEFTLQQQRHPNHTLSQNQEIAFNITELLCWP